VSFGTMRLLIAAPKPVSPGRNGYVQRVRWHAQLLFCSNAHESLSGWAKSIRVYNVSMATVGVFASIFDPMGRVLLVRRAYGSRRWTTPGGRVEQGESPLAALQREVTEEIACEVRIAHLLGVYAKPYRDDLVLSFLAELVRGTPRACFPEICDIAFFAREKLPRELAFNARLRVEDAFENCRGIFRVFDSAASLAPPSFPQGGKV